MGVQGFQEYLEKRCPGAAVPVDLLKLARTAARQILIDADSGLQRLYGGYQTDWVCGGEWNAMLGYLAALSQAFLYQGGLELVVVFNGTLGKERWPEWARRAQGQRQTAQLIVNHVGSKATPPPRAWFLPPACLSHCVRLAMFRFRVRVVQTLEDHHQEVLCLYRDYGFAGLIAQDSEFALCNVPAYFSSHALKLSWNGKNLTTHQYLLSEAARQLGLKTQHLACFAALLGNHILPDEDLAAFHWSLLGPEHPLASLKVRAHQLVLPPCEVVIKAVSEYVSSIKDLGNLDAIARDVFKQSQSRMEDKVERFKKAVEYFSAASKPRSPNMGPTSFICDHLTDKPSRWEDPAGRGGSTSGDGSQGNGSGSNIPSLLSMATRSHMDITTPPLPQVSAEVLRVAEHRHRRGLMYPQIYHILTKGEMKMPVCIEDECNSELPPASLLFRTARQYAYGVLFSLAETHRRLERLALRKRAPLEVPPVIVKEWSSGKAKSALTPELVAALCFREWTCPNLRRLWLGRASEDRSRRTRAFLACLRSDCPALLNPAQVPQHLLLMCCVLRYMMQWPGGRILQRHELDAFLAQAVSSQLYEPDQLQELKVEKVDARGVQLAALFMAGVDTALFINDVCGQPLPWEHCCPWGFFDGKLFQSKLARAARDRAALLDMCEGQEELVSKVEKMRQAILEGINLSPPPPPPPPLPPPAFLPPTMVPPFYPMPPLYPPRPISGMPPHHHPHHPPQHRPRSCFLSSGIQSIPPQGGKLEIAGMVVGQWAGNKPVRGRGGFNMQVVSVGAGKGTLFLFLHHSRGKEIPAKVRGGKRAAANRTQVLQHKSNFYTNLSNDVSLFSLMKRKPPEILTSSKFPRLSYSTSFSWMLLFCENSVLTVLQMASPPPASSPPKPSEEEGSTPEVATQQLNGSSAASAIGQPLELAPLAQPIPCALASRDNQSEGVEVEVPCCLDDCPSDGALQKEE
uniref:Family with sequence similarity 120C n=1 Tax=Mastacembelus armatus TaxID=205130 RepID=A0A7N8WS00_9TELE